MSKRLIPAGTVTIEGVAKIWGVSKRTAQRRVVELKADPIPSVRKIPLIWLEAKIRALAPEIPVEPKERGPRKGLPTNRYGVVTLASLKKTAQKARATKGGAK